MRQPGAHRAGERAGEDVTHDVAVGARAGRRRTAARDVRTRCQNLSPIRDAAGPRPAKPVTALGSARLTSGTSAVRHSRTGGVGAGLILSALVLLLLMIFILQNGNPVLI